MNLAECPCAGRHLDKLIQPALLAVLAQEPTHGYRLLQRLARLPMFAGQRPDATGVYRFLKAMEERGLVSSAWDLSERGPAKRLYDLTPRGRRCLALWRSTLTEYHGQVGRLLDVVRAACRSAAGGDPDRRGHAKRAGARGRGNR